MSPRVPLAAVATAALVLLTLATGYLFEHHASPWALAGNACLKVALIGWVFLELDRAWPVWAALVGMGTVGVAFGAAGLMGG
ncbi:hypothetical protein L6R53_16035 [Myxococcota bacterium]|nr:hypothetical protein [Myxococcota bacterium]